MGIDLLVAALCVLANGFFVAAEFALVKVRVTQLKARARKGEPRAAGALKITDKLDAYLSAAQLGITVASLALGWIGEPALAELLTPILHWIGVQSEAVIHGIALSTALVIITMLHIVIGEQAPKMYAIQRAEAVSLWVATPMRVFYLATFPFLFIINLLSNLSLRAFKLPPLGHGDGPLSAEELKLLVAGGRIGTQKRELMERVLQATDRPVRVTMVPRVDMVTVSLLDTPEQIMESLRADGYSRVPVIEGRDPDKVVGYIYLKDLFLGNGLPKGGIGALRRDILFVPESRTVGDVLEDFKRTHIPIAIVVDEYGGTSGLVTMEDILEVIVGELQDELDVESPAVQRREDGTLIAEGTVPISELASFGVETEPIEGHDILAGHIVSKLGRLARPGDHVQFGDFDATVEDVRSRRVTRVRLSHRPPPEPPETKASTRPPPKVRESEKPPGGYDDGSGI